MRETERGREGEREGGREGEKVRVFVCETHKHTHRGRKGEGEREG